MQHSDSSFTPQEVIKLVRLFNAGDDHNIRLALAICEGGEKLPQELLKKISGDPKIILYCLEEGYQKILSSFRFIYIRWSSLSFIPPNIRYLQSALMLDLGYNRISEIDKDLYTLTQLKKLRLLKNQIHRIDAEIADLVHLEELDLSANRLDTLPVEITHLRNLKKLILSDNPLDDPQIERLRNYMPQVYIDFS